MAGQNQPYAPNAFDQLQLAFGVDNDRTRALAQLRAQAEQSIQTPGAQVPAQPLAGVPGQTPGGSNFFGGDGGGIGDFLRQRFQQLRQEFAPTENKVRRAEEAAGVSQPQPQIDLRQLQSFGK
jgi:hypothetical protein